ncbi:MAG: type VI secretion system tip protein TssI/VgrG [Bacteroidota bacterium]
MAEPHRQARHEFSSEGTTSPFRVVSFEGTETISQTFRFEIDLVSDDAEIDLASVIDQPATLTMYRGEDPAEVSGIVTSLLQTHEAGKQSEFRYGYRAVLEPRLSRLRFSFQNRIFQNQTVEEITGKILKDAEVDVEFDLKASYDPRDYTTQYKETDLDFVQRLWEYEGIRYSFRHENGSEMVVVSDTAADAQPISGEAEVLYSHADGLRPADSVETIRDFVVEQRLVTAAARIKDYNYREPGTSVLSEQGLSGKGQTGVLSDFGIHAKTPDDAKRLATVRAEEIESERVTVTGTGDCLRFRSGQTFDLGDYYRGDLNVSYLITSVSHVGSQPDAEEAQLSDELISNYSNAFTCVPATAPYRPPRLTPEPKLPGVLTAKVESAGGDYAPIDDQGRYHVRFPFDLGDAGDAQATKPVRLAQPYTGPNYGQHFPVHKDAEMVVACVDGNVDRILGLATVPNPSQASPVTSTNPTENTVRTWANNHLVLQDLKGKVGIDLFTPTAKSRIHMGADEKSVQGIQSSTEGTQTIQAGGGIFMKVGKTADQLSSVLASKDISQLMSDLTLVDGAVGIALGAIGAGKGLLKNVGFWNGALNTALGTTLGLAWPGLYVAAEGGVMMGTPAGISAYAGAGGIGLSTATGIDLTAATLGINLMAGAGGISMGVGIGDITGGSGKGNITFKTKLGHVTNHTKNGNISYVTGKGDATVKTDDGNIMIHTPKGMLRGEAKTKVQLTSTNDDIQLRALEGHVGAYAAKSFNVTADEGVAIKTFKKSVIVEAKDSIELRCGKATLILRKNGDIVINGKDIDLKGSGKLVAKASSNVKITGSKVAIK